MKTRTLEPQAPPMEGSDVAMLEAILWHLGLSPQHMYKNASGNNEGAGSTGTRLGAMSATLGGIVGGKKGPEGRSLYSTGMSGPPGSGSLERMIKRFQGRNIGAKADSAATNAGATSDGVVDKAFFQRLVRVWKPYWQAYERYDDSRVIAITDRRLGAWLSAAVEIWQNGKASLVPPTYTQRQHKTMLVNAGKSSTWKTRAELLRAWKTQEASRGHWGRGAPQTDYRMTEGGSDEFGSLSFNQIRFAYRYSDAPCTIHGSSGLNFYDPLENAQGFTVHTAASKTTSSGEVNCEGSFFRAYAQGAGGMANTYNMNDLVGYRNGNDDIRPIGAADGSYEVLAKAIGAYNGGLSFTQNRSWSRLLRETRTTSQFENTADTCFSCSYAITVLKQRFGLDYRTYIWKGGEKDVVTTPDDPNTPENEEVTKTVDWCFKYGEKEWMNGKIWKKYLKYAKDYNAGIPTPGTPDPRVSCP